mgnify:CR=1 FL=1
MVTGFELLREGGIRLPAAIGPALSIVGALIIGDAAVKAGLIGSFWLTSNIEANTYPGQVKEIRTIGVPSVLICHKQLGEDEAYKIISAILENPDEISMLVYPRRPYSLQAAAVEIGVPRHPGAQKYLQEKISLSHHNFLSGSLCICPSELLGKR